MVDEVVWAPRQGASGEDVYHWPDGGRVLSGVRAWRELTGLVSRSGTTVTGVGTFFTTEVAVNDWLVVPGSVVQARKVQSIADDTGLLVATAFSSAAVGQIASLVPTLTEVNDSTGMLQIYGEIERLSVLWASLPNLPDYHDVPTTKRILAATITDLQSKIGALLNYSPFSNVSPTGGGTLLALEGVADKAIGFPNVVGHGTKFLQQLLIGDTIRIPHLLPAPGVETKVVAAVADDEHLTVTTNFVRAATNQVVTRLRNFVIRKKILEQHLYELRKGLANQPPVAYDQSVLYGDGCGVPLQQDLVLVATDATDHPASFITFSLVDTPYVVLTGTVSKTGGTKNLAGVGTLFLSEVQVGQMIRVPGTAADYRIVATIADNTHLTVTANFTSPSSSGQTAWIVPGTYALVGSVTKPVAQTYNRTARFTPARGNWPAAGTLDFTFQANDRFVDSNIATVDMTLNPPRATGVDATMADGTALNTTAIDLLVEDDMDHDVNWMTISVVEDPGLTLVGTVTKSTGAGRPNLVGVGTQFTTDLRVGQTIQVAGPLGIVETALISAIADNTHLSTVANWANASSGQTLRRKLGSYTLGAVTRTSAGRYKRVMTFMPNADHYGNIGSARPDPFIGILNFTYKANDGVKDSVLKKIYVTVSSMKVVFWTSGGTLPQPWYVNAPLLALDNNLRRTPAAAEWPPVGAIAINAARREGKIAVGTPGAGLYRLYERVNFGREFADFTQRAADQKVFGYDFVTPLAPPDTFVLCSDSNDKGALAATLPFWTTLGGGSVLASFPIFPPSYFTVPGAGLPYANVLGEAAVSVWYRSNTEAVPPVGDLSWGLGLVNYEMWFDYP